MAWLCEDTYYHRRPDELPSMSDQTPRDVLILIAGGQGRDFWAQWPIQGSRAVYGMPMNEMRFKAVGSGSMGVRLEGRV